MFNTNVPSKFYNSIQRFEKGVTLTTNSEQITQSAFVYVCYKILLQTKPLWLNKTLKKQVAPRWHPQIAYTTKIYSASFSNKRLGKCKRKIYELFLQQNLPHTIINGDNQSTFK
jgi:hypothetical protein